MGLWGEVVVEEEEAFFRWRSTKGEGEVVVRLSLERCLPVCWAMTAQVTFRAKAAVVEVLFGAHSELVRVPEEVELAAQEVLFEMELVGLVEAVALWEVLERMWVVVQAVQAPEVVVVVLAAQYGQAVRERNQEAGAEVRMAWTVLCWRMGWAVVWPSWRWQMLPCRRSFSAWACHWQTALRAATPGRSHSAWGALAGEVRRWSWHQHWRWSRSRQQHPRCQPPAVRTCR